MLILYTFLLSTNSNILTVISSLGINVKEQLLQQTSKKQLQELWRSAAAAFLYATVYSPVIHFSDLLLVSQQQNLQQINMYIYLNLNMQIILMKFLQ